jgi:DNA polymerase-3 subunit alpha
MWRQQHVAFRAYSKRVFYKEELTCRHLILKIFRQKIQEIQLIGNKHNLKQASDQIRQQFGKRSTGISRMNWLRIKEVLAEAKFAHLHNHAIFGFAIHDWYWSASGCNG